jgi:hypothetical protein
VPDAKPPRTDDRTGVPGLPTWTHVYVFVGCSFLLWLALLTLLTLSFA